MKRTHLGPNGVWMTTENGHSRLATEEEIADTVAGSKVNELPKMFLSDEELEARLPPQPKFERKRVLTPKEWGIQYERRTWRHHVWDMLVDAWNFCFRRKP